LTGFSEGLLYFNLNFPGLGFFGFGHRNFQNAVLSKKSQRRRQTLKPEFAEGFFW
jgi:hypothetical protein